MRQLLFFALSIAILWSCDLEKEIEIQLPDYEPSIVVECYLEPDQPFALLLTESTPYFEPFPDDISDYLDATLLDSAEVEILHKGTIYSLQNQLFFDPVKQKIYNYYLPVSVPYDTDSPFELRITTKDGRTIEASTKLLPRVAIDSIVVEFQENDTLARLLTYFTDPPEQENYYRRMLHEESLDSTARQDFPTDDRIFNGDVVFGTTFDFSEGTVVFNTLYHIDEDYYKFLESVNGAINASLNPFAQPSSIISNVTGTGNPIGIFTGLVYDRVETIIQR
ncbi:MAG TPA: DUF4249 domain-containing protein [Saprospiraceae bacterium]|nr:DUF4249 domain-containing protein [Saprospiraceae bacterium]HMQ81571.1 DUF4249 domain-containing protein [Saprospiraceae bacterium]